MEKISALEIVEQTFLINIWALVNESMIEAKKQNYLILRNLAASATIVPSAFSLLIRR